jgi:hypothetical protein
MPNKLGLPVVLVTCAMVAASIWLWVNVMVNNTDYGIHTDSIRFLTVGVVILTLVMLAGCYAVYQGWSQEDLESMAPKQ